MTIEQLASDALQLNSHERAILAELIWESLEDPYFLASELSDVESLALSLQRDKEIEQGTAIPLSHADLMGRLRHEN